jgi:DNA mismatch endonuclease (patch repair protein)
MSDVFTRAKRSQVMSRIRSRGNRDTEERLVRLFREFRIVGWRRNNARVFGRPDFVFRGEKVAVFVDGCFWHRHEGCRFAYVPKTGLRGLDFWLSKFEANIARDKAVNQTLRKSGWKVLRIWECQLHRRNWPKIARRIHLARKGHNRQTTTGREKQCET